ncbi:CheY-like chemotaxis protein [Variovorax boronicumulans]|uniref:response regulator n=1 Tax=Variovorax boronicumulans TaxID=436515 RepID=UPI002474995C|nr:response regulator [Variovorax boronicumulans]MDH6165337.1 CheY-like chemotaxis protein [Variovorax boronicumulans]
MTNDPPNKLRVLLVEDDADTLATTLKLLEALGHWATGVKSAEAAISRFFEGAFDVVMVDIGLPALSGLDLAERLLRDYRVPVIFVTGQAQPAKELAGTTWLRKPYTVEQLTEALEQVA